MILHRRASAGPSLGSLTSQGSPRVAPKRPFIILWAAPQRGLVCSNRSFRLTSESSLSPSEKNRLPRSPNRQFSSAGFPWRCAWGPIQRPTMPQPKQQMVWTHPHNRIAEFLLLGGFRSLHELSKEKQTQQQRQSLLLQGEQELKASKSHAAPPGMPPLQLSRVVVLNKVTRFEVSLAEKMAAWRREHLSRSSNSNSSSSSSGAAASATADGTPGEDPSLYTPGSRAYEAAAAAAEAEAAAALSRDFPSAYRTHILHHKTAAEVYRQLREDYGLHVTVIKARTIRGLSISRKGAVALPPDAVISAGGDGTYLEAASIVPGFVPGEPSGPWLFGINTDPARSEGRLCVKSPLLTHTFSDKQNDQCQQQQAEQQVQLQQEMQRHRPNGVGDFMHFQTPRVPDQVASPKGEANNGSPQDASVGAILAVPGAEFDVKNYVAATLRRLLFGGCRLVTRQRIRTTLRFPTHMQRDIEERISRKQEEHRASRGGGAQPREALRPISGVQRKAVGGELLQGSSSRCSGLPSSRQVGGPRTVGDPLGGLTFDSGSPVCGGRPRGACGEEMMEMQLAFLAVNDVLVSDANVSKTIYADMWVDGKASRHKSSGILVSTGTGSSAWHYNMGSVCKEQAKAVAEELLRLRPQLKDRSGSLTDQELQHIVSRANAQLLLDPGSPFLRFLVREPIENRTMGLGREIRVRPLAGEVVVSMDGLEELPLPPLVELVLSVHPGDALWTAQ